MMQVPRMSLLDGKKSLHFSDDKKAPDLEISDSSHTENQLWYFDRGSSQFLLSATNLFLMHDILVALVRDLQPEYCYKLINAKLVHRALDLSGGDRRTGMLLVSLMENEAPIYLFRSYRLGSTWER